MLDSCFVPSLDGLLSYYSSILPSVFVHGAPRALIAKTKSNQSQGREAAPSKGPTFLPRV